MPIFPRLRDRNHNGLDCAYHDDRNSDARDFEPATPATGEDTFSLVFQNISSNFIVIHLHLLYDSIIKSRKERETALRLLYCPQVGDGPHLSSKALCQTFYILIGPPFSGGLFY